MKDMGILPPQERATPRDMKPIPFQKNVKGALGAYATYVALEPYYDNLIVTHVNGAGVDLIGFKHGIPENIEVKNWAQRYKTGPSMTPNKYRAEVRTRFPRHGKDRKILVTSATWSNETGMLMSEDSMYPYRYIHQITSLPTFSQAVAEIRYQHELRLWKDHEERRLFNITIIQQSGSAFEASNVVVVGSCFAVDACLEENNECYPPENSILYESSEPILRGHHRRHHNEMHIYRLQAEDESMHAEE